MDNYNNNYNGVKSGNGLAVASLVLGILSIVCMGPLTGIPAIITGSIANSKGPKNGMATAGFVMGILSILWIVIIIIFWASFAAFLGMSTGY